MYDEDVTTDNDKEKVQSKDVDASVTTESQPILTEADKPTQQSKVEPFSNQSSCNITSKARLELRSSRFNKTFDDETGSTDQQGKGPIRSVAKVSISNSKKSETGTDKAEVVSVKSDVQTPLPANVTEVRSIGPGRSTAQILRSS
jgi:hypothetical protein